MRKPSTFLSSRVMRECFDTKRTITSDCWLGIWTALLQTDVSSCNLVSWQSMFSPFSYCISTRPRWHSTCWRPTCCAAGSLENKICASDRLKKTWLTGVSNALKYHVEGNKQKGWFCSSRRSVFWKRYMWMNRTNFLDFLAWMVEHASTQIEGYTDCLRIYYRMIHCHVIII